MIKKIVIATIFCLSTNSTQLNTMEKINNGVDTALEHKKLIVGGCGLVAGCVYIYKRWPFVSETKMKIDLNQFGITQKNLLNEQRKKVQETLGENTVKINQSSELLDNISEQIGELANNDANTKLKIDSLIKQEQNFNDKFRVQLNEVSNQLGKQQVIIKDTNKKNKATLEKNNRLIREINAKLGL